jgi:hypothetical protein
MTATDDLLLGARVADVLHEIRKRKDLGWRQTWQIINIFRNYG